MSHRGKKIFLAVSIILPFVVYCFIYYSKMIRNAPYNFSEFESLTYKYGMGEDLVNQYHSKTSEFRYLNRKDSLIVKRVKLRKDDLLYLHRKAVQLGFWDYPDAIGDKHKKTSPHYYLELRYKRKAKQVLLDLDYETDNKLHDAAKSMMDEVNKTIIDAENRGR